MNQRGCVGIAVERTPKKVDGKGGRTVQGRIRAQRRGRRIYRGEDRAQGRGGVGVHKAEEVEDKGEGEKYRGREK